MNKKPAVKYNELLKGGDHLLANPCNDYLDTDQNTSTVRQRFRETRTHHLETYMKKSTLVIFAIFLIYQSTAIAQPADSAIHLYAEDNAVHWQKVYDTDRTWQQIIAQLRVMGKVNEVSTDSSSMRGEIKEYTSSAKSSGFSAFSYPVFFTPDYGMKATFLIEYRKGRYRVTVREIVAVSKIQTYLEDIGNITRVETILLKGGKFRPSWKKTAPAIFEADFDKVFLLQKAKQKDW